MMVLRRLFLALLMIGCFAGCKAKIVTSGELVKKIDAEEVSRIVINFSTKMKVEKHLELEDSWTAYKNNIETIYLRYSSQRLLTVYDARLILVELVEEFLHRINSNSIVGFEVERPPLSANDLDVKIAFQSYYGRYIDELYVGCVWLQNGMVYFYAFDRKDLSMNGIDWDHHRFEPYFKSRELALLKREADVPFTDVRLLNEKKQRIEPPHFENYFSPTL